MAFRAHFGVMDRLKEYERANWFGLRRRVKALLGLRPLNAAARALLPKGRRFSSFPVSLAEVEGAVDGGRFVLLDPLRCSIARELYWGGGRRLAPSEAFALELFCRLARRASLVLDVGANTGLFSLAAASVNSKLAAHAFEIVPEVFVALYRNVARNDLLDRVVCHHVGLGRDGAVIRLPETEDAGSLPLSFSSEWDVPGGRKVAFRSLDALAPALPAGPVLAKIDVEGTEDEVLRHGEAFLRAREPELLCEILPGAAKVGFLEPLLRRHGYALLKIGDDGLIPAERLEPDERHHDWLFTKRPGEAAR